MATTQSAHAQVVKILPLGDSWTDGVGHHVSDRYDLWFDLIDAGFDVDFVGIRSVIPGSQVLCEELQAD